MWVLAGQAEWKTEGAPSWCPFSFDERGVSCDRGQWLPQVEHLPPLHEAQLLDPLPATRRLPPPSRLKAAKVEITLRASGVPQRGQVMGAPDSIIGRSASKR